ncbi:FAD-binding oxidoreductase [Sphingomonas sp. KR1UV-12]|uniref:FAD-binding oxidoreductase n=1 Tax=Sphingomonas aurea TaxID=3063994 RepID=A0ABT9ELX1_9SPHN|nr:FAD-binding oxidoreductase [Sphingomonas sp. KR1UV-12]MDP1027954.1 FAD-binding oxidoreductase [Sphingomonas sp. KR1UV-12]
MSVAVVGAGIVGRSVALALAQRGERVVLVDPMVDRSASSWGNAGHLATEQVAPLASPAMIRSVPRRLFALGGALDLPLGQVGAWLPFAMRLLAASTPARFSAGSAALGGLLAEAMPAWRRLAEAIGARDLLREDGHLLAWPDRAKAAAGRAAWQAADTGTATVTDASTADLATLRALSPQVAAAIRFTGSGQVADLDRLASALEAALATAGVRFVRQRADLTCKGGQVAVTGVAADRVVVAAGIGARSLMAAAGHRVPLIAERGYHIRGSAEHWPADLPPVVFEDRSIIVTRYADSVQVAGFVELGRADTAPDPRKWQRLERHVAELGLPIAGPYRRWMGARPTLPDYLPAIGRSTRADNLFYAFGHQHLGLTLAPVTGELLAAAMTEQAPAIDLTPFAVKRF